MTSPVNILFTNHLNEAITANSLTIPGLTPVLNGIDATVTIEIPITNVQEAFYFKTDSLIATDATDDVHCYVNTSKWVTMVNNINASTGTISLANNAFVESDVISKDFLRNVANGLFGTHLGVDLFTNETTVAQNLEAQTLTVANSIKSTMDDVGIAGTDVDLSVDASGNKYFLDTVTGTKNVTRSLLLQLLAASPERFHSSNFGSYQLSGEPGSYRMPLNVGDSLSYALTINPDPNQNTSVNTGTNAESRKYRVKLVMADLPTSFSFTNLIDLDAEVAAEGYTMEDKTDVNTVTKNSFHISNKTVIPGSHSYIPDLILDTGFMVYMFWAYVYDDGAGSAVETVNSDAPIGIYSHNLGFSNMALCFLNGDINGFSNHKASTPISAETWTHCAVVLEFATGSFKVYYNAVEQSVPNNTSSDNTQPFRVKLNSFSTYYNNNSPVYINNLCINNDATSYTEAESMINEHYSV